MKLYKLAAIDIGSNAVRLLVKNVIERNRKIYYRKSSLIRIPIRLGEEAFLKGKISVKTRNNLVETMIAFKYLMKAQDVMKYKGAATSAMREASNGADIVKEIKKKSGIGIDIIDGKEEARILYSTHIAQQLNIDKVYLYVDVGGGSTELTLFAEKNPKVTESFNIGTLRILNKTVKKKDWKVMQDWIANAIKTYKPDSLIGSGGNINRAFKMIGSIEGKYVTRYNLDQLKSHVQSYSYERRVLELDMRPDRADVIVPALSIFTNVMEWSDCDKIFVPKMGLADGLIRIQYEKYAARKQK
ncbi:MAG: exopolyphosphatase [Chitinophagales bacterium]|nr:exopolyphosphatase [Chitinophagales bacterium]